MNPLALGNALWKVLQGMGLVVAGSVQLFDIASGVLGGGDKQKGTQRLIEMGQGFARLTSKNS